MSRSDERATQTRGMYLGTLVTVADAEAVGVMLAWEESDRVALDSQGVIQRSTPGSRLGTRLNGLAVWVLLSLGKG